MHIESARLRETYLQGAYTSCHSYRPDTYRAVSPCGYVDGAPDLKTVEAISIINVTPQ